MAELQKDQMLLSEVLQKVSNAKTKAQKIKILKDLRTDALVSILIWNYDDSVKSMLPEGDVPYTPNDAPVGTEHTRLLQEYRKLFHFVKGGNDSLQRTTRERMFIQMLEGLSAAEASLICLVKDKNFRRNTK